MTDKQDGYMNRYLDYVLNNPKKMLLFLAAVTLILGSGLPKIEFDSSIDSIMPKKDEEYRFFQDMKKVYGNTGNFIIMCVSNDDPLDPEFLSTVDRFLIDIEEYELPDFSVEESRLQTLNMAAEETPLRRETLLQLFENDPPFQRYIERFLKKYGSGMDMITAEKMETLTERFKTTIEVKELYLIDRIISPLTMKDLIGRDDTLISYDLIERDEHGARIIPRTPEEIAEFEKRLRHNPAFERGIYAVDGDTGRITDFGIMLRLYDSLWHDLLVEELKLIKSGYSSTLDITLQGIPVVNNIINDYLKGDLKRFLPLAFMVMIIIFYLNFRSIRGVFLPFTTLVLADIWIVGLMGHLGFKLTVIGVSLPSLMTAVGSSYSIHILNQYYIEHDDIEREGMMKGLKGAMSHISLTVTLAGVTTFFGFLMLITNQVSAIREMGIFSAIGVLFAVFISVTLIPSVLILLKLDRPSTRKNLIVNVSPVERITSLFTRLALDHGKATIAVLCVILMISLTGLTKVSVESSVHAYFKEGDKVITSSKLMGEKFGGTFGLSILIDSGEEGGAKNPEILKFVEEFREWLVADENIDINIGRTDALTDYIKSMHLAMHDNNFEYYRIPDEKIDIESYISIYPGRDDRDTGIADDLEPYVDWTFQTLNIFARIWEREGEFLTSGTLAHIIERIETYLDENLPEGYTYRTAGEPRVMLQLASHIVTGQVMSLFFSLIVVSFIVFLLFKNWRAALVALIPIGTAVMFNFGVMGYVGIRIDLATAIIASIAIGIGIDDTIHFLNTYRRFKTLKYSRRDAIASTLRITGKAIIYTSLALTFGFLVVTVSSFKPVIYFGILVATTLLATTVGALLFLPAVINTFDVDMSPSGKSSIFWKYFDLNRFLGETEKSEIPDKE